MNDEHCNPNKRHDFVYLFDVTDGNPNGDPDAGNMPRVDPETMHGIVTDVCIKRKIRDYVAGVLGREIFIQSENALNTLVVQATKTAKDADGNPVGLPLEVNLAEVPEAKALLDQEDDEFTAYLEALETDFEFDSDAGKLAYEGEAKSAKALYKALAGQTEPNEKLKAVLGTIAKKFAETKKKAPSIDARGRGIVKFDLCKKYFDIRMFGAVLTAGTNFGQVRGPMQLTFARTVDPIQPRDLSITRVAITKASDHARKSTEMGRKAIVPYGLYRLHGFYNPLLGRSLNAKNERVQLITVDDLKDCWAALSDLFTFDRSAARGEMRVRGLYVFTHEGERGDAPAHRLFELISVTPRGKAQTFEEYRNGITVPDAGSLELYPKVTLSVLASEPKKPPVAAAGS
jgi:CRISPR-associated protein Csd2